MRGEQDFWTDERIVLLQKLWGEGAAASAIGTQLGVSRSAVLGKINRMRRLASGGARSPKQRPKKAPKSEASDTHSCRGSLTPSPTRRRVKPCDQPETSHTTAKACRKRLLELTNNSCRWPLGNHPTAQIFFCGLPEANLELGIPYCRRHMRRAYLMPWRPSRQKKLSVVPVGGSTPRAQP
jgi:GcrA cell cycle regulator